MYTMRNLNQVQKQEAKHLRYLHVNVLLTRNFSSCSVRGLS